MKPTPALVSLVVLASSLACHHKALDVRTTVPQVRAEVERGDGEWVYSLWLPNPGGGEAWRAESPEGLGLAVTDSRPETLVRWRQPLGAYRDRPFAINLRQGTETYPIQVDAARSSWSQSLRRTLVVVEGLMRGHIVWPT